mmetsp:Transcript_25850/g.65408  ORF Transcript_25850/g.65408 Transcript_25850/m.65408 type:complete len:245 (+) Transcript_25850:2464-3198(+)
MLSALLLTSITVASFFAPTMHSVCSASGMSLLSTGGEGPMHGRRATNTSTSPSANTGLCAHTKCAPSIIVSSAATSTGASLGMIPAIRMPIITAIQMRSSSTPIILATISCRFASLSAKKWSLRSEAPSNITTSPNFLAFSTWQGRGSNNMAQPGVITVSSRPLLHVFTFSTAGETGRERKRRKGLLSHSKPSRVSNARRPSEGGGGPGGRATVNDRTASYSMSTVGSDIVSAVFDCTKVTVTA